jgi:hypothetical protein
MQGESAAKRRKEQDGICHRDAESTELETLLEQAPEGDTPGVLYRCECKGVVKRGVCKLMRTEGLEIDKRTLSTRRDL